MLCVVVTGIYVMSLNKPNIIDGINIHDPVMCFLDDHIGDYTDAMLLINKIMSILKLSKFVTLIFIPAKKQEKIPAKKHGRKRPPLQRCDVKELSYQALQDGSDSINDKNNAKEGSWSHNMDTLQEAYLCHKSNQQKNFLILVKSDNRGEFTVKYQFLEVNDIPKIAILCKQPQLPDDKAICFIDSKTYQVTNKCMCVTITNIEPMHKSTQCQIYVL